MNGGIEVNGMVLEALPAGEFDRRVVILTKERGKISAFARRARRQDSPLLAATTPFAMGRFVLYEGRNSYTLVQADIREYFDVLRTDLTGVCFGSYFMEFAAYYAVENQEAGDQLNLLYAALRALEKKAMPQQLVRYVFEIRMMVLGGEFPQDVIRDPTIDETVRYTVRHIVREPLKSLFSFTVSEETLSGLSSLQDAIRGKYTDRRFKSLAILEQIYS